MVVAKKEKALIPVGVINKIDVYWRAGLQRRAAEETEELRGMFGGVAMSRYREGLTDELGFADELRLLGYPETDIPRYQAAGRLAYALDYWRDLLAAWRDAVRKGNMSIEVYAGKLAETGLVPERVAGYVLREIARLKPEEALKVTVIPKAYYETDEGRVDIDTIRRLRRKLRITRDQEIGYLRELGMPVALATSYADNDDARLAEKGEEE